MSMLAMIRRVLRFSGKYAGRIRLAFLFSFLKSLCMNAPIVMAITMIDQLRMGTADLHTVFWAMAGMVTAFVLYGVFQYLTDHLQSSAGYEIMAEKRMEFGQFLRKLPMGFFSAGNVGRISSILSNDMVFIEENSMNVVADVMSDIFSQLILIVFLAWIHPLFGGIVAVTSIVAMGIAYVMNRGSYRESGERQKAIEEVNDAVLEYAEGFGVIKGFHVEGESAAKLRGAFADNAKKNIGFEEYLLPWQIALLVLYGIGTAAVLWAAIWLYGRGELTVSYFIGVMLFLFHLFSPMKHLYQQGTRFTTMENGLKRMEEVYGESTLADAGSEHISKAETDEAISFSQVSFSYDDRKVLQNVTFSVKQGETVAIVGESGSGKTTIANLLARFWDASDGTIRIMGQDIKKIPVAELMDQVGMVFQHVYLFEDTIYNNIVMGNVNCSREDVIRAAKSARCYDFIMELPFGFETVVGEGGASLSGGQAQRISIARCILKDAPIIIMDEATASIDADNEYYIQQALSALCRDKTTLMIAHKLNTIEHADRILDVADGTIAEEGNHEQLMARNGRYAKMVAARSSLTGWNGER